MNQLVVWCLISLLFSPTLGTSVVRATNCKAVPGSPHWPAPSAWQAFNKTLGGALLAPLPPAIVCDASQPEHNAVACTELGTLGEWFNSSFNAANPVSLDFPNWQDDACLPQILESHPKCNLKPFPHYVVKATNAQQIAAALKFAGTNNVRLSVKGTGHDLLGRSTSPGLSIWTHNIRGITIQPSFKPQGCAKCTGVPAVTVAAGEQWRNIYPVVAAAGRLVVGGGDPDVGVGGYTTGGGHSPISAKYGLAADNVLEMELVTPMGDIVTANANQHSDLFWAMRGGGGATFGVLTSLTYKTHPTSQITSFVLQFNSSQDEATKNNNTNFYKAAAYVNAQLPTLSEAGLMGYYYINAADAGSSSGSTGYSIQIKPNSKPVPMSMSFFGIGLDVSVNAMLDLFNDVSSKLSSNPSLVSYFQAFPASELNLLDLIISSPDTVGINVRLGSRLLDKKAVTDQAGMAKILPLYARTQLQGIFTTGPGVRAVPVNENAVNPAWRKAYLHSIAVLAIPFTNFQKEDPIYASYLTHTLTQALRDLSPDTGCYVNEADADEPDYEQAFWGDHYPRLAALKTQYDPHGVLWCKDCVGGAAWAVQQDTLELCKV